MMRFGFSLVVPVALGIVTLPALTQDAQSEKKAETGKKNETVDPSGTWRLEFDWRGQQIKDAYRLALGKDGRVTGKLHRGKQSFEIKNGKIKGDELSFVISGDFQGTEWVTNYVGKIAGDKLTGTVSLTYGDNSYDFPWTPKRSVEMEDVLGTWSILIPRRNGSAWNPTLVVAKDGDKHKGQYISTDGTRQEVTDLAVKDNQLTFRAVVERFGTKVVMTYTGRPYGPSIKDGTLDLNAGAAKVDFTATLTLEKKEQSAGE